MSAPAVSAPVTVPANPGPQLTCVLLDEAWCGIHYLPSPSVTLQGQNATINESGNHVIAIGATSWTVADIAGQQVGTGTMADTATAIEVCSDGTWVGGGTAVPGHYTVFTNPGTNGVASGSVVICPASSNLYVPVSTGDEPYNLSAWLGGACDRDYYSTPEINLYSVEATAADSGAAIVTNHTADAYFQGPQDTARPRKLWVASSTQADEPTQGPTSTWWGQLATYLAANGCAGAWYECPTNEPENGGWTTAEIVTYWQACSTAILAADSTAHVMGWCSAGIYSSSPITAVATFLSECSAAVFTNHMENSHQNLGDFVALRQLLGGLKAQFTTSGVPDLDLRLTETGIEGGGYSVLQPRREARQRTLLRLVAESFGWAKENCYDFLVWDHLGSGLTMYQVEGMANGGSGNMRAGDYALHVLAEALYGTSCSPTDIPAKLAFGATGSAADSLFMGLHYTGTSRDVVVLATNGVPSAQVTLNVSATGTVTYWDGMGVPSTATVTDGQITVDVNDLLTYVFLPASSTVSVVDTDQGVVALSAATNLALDATVVNQAATAVPVVHNGSFAENNSDVTGISAPYTTTTLPATLTFTNLGGSASAQTVSGFAFKGPAPAWQTAGSSFTAFTVTVDGDEVFSYADPTAVSAAIPSPSNGNSSDPCTRTTWWRSPYGFVVQLAEPVQATSLELSVTATGYGGQPDSAASTVSENDSQEVQLSELQIFGAVNDDTVTVPGAPTDVVATAGVTSASVAFTAPSSDGNATITGYTVTASSDQTATGTSSPIDVTGLTGGAAVTFTVTATNSAGTGTASAASAAVTPSSASSGGSTSYRIIDGQAVATTRYRIVDGEAVIDTVTRIS